MLAENSPVARGGDIRDKGSISGSGRSRGGGHGKLLQYSCLEDPMDRGAWQARVQAVTESDMTEKLNNKANTDVFSSVQSLSHVRLFATP